MILPRIVIGINYLSFENVRLFELPHTTDIAFHVSLRRL